jgi:formate/nitrite transporter FocA (FNT family)
MFHVSTLLPYNEWDEKKVHTHMHSISHTFSQVIPCELVNELLINMCVWMDRLHGSE